MKNKQEDRFGYDSDKGLNVLSEQEYVNLFNKEEEKDDEQQDDKEIKKGGFEQWL
jgi:hypothetical protein